MKGVPQATHGECTGQRPCTLHNYAVTPLPKKHINAVKTSALPPGCSQTLVLKGTLRNLCQRQSWEAERISFDTFVLYFARMRSETPALVSPVSSSLQQLRRSYLVQLFACSMPKSGILHRRSSDKSFSSIPASVTSSCW